MVRTKPVGISNQPDFVNGAVKIETTMRQNELRQYLKKLEDRLGPRPLGTQIRPAKY